MTANDDIRKLIKEVSGVDLPPDAPPEEPVVIRRPEDMPYYWHNKGVQAENERLRKKEEREKLWGVVLVSVPVGLVLWLFLKFI
jgi:hypothetical protein